MIYGKNMIDGMLDLLIIAIILLLRLYFFGKTSFKRAILYTIFFLLIYIIYILDRRNNLNIDIKYYLLMIIFWGLFGIIFEFKDNIIYYYAKILKFFKKKS